MFGSIRSKNRQAGLHLHVPLLDEDERAGGSHLPGAMTSVAPRPQAPPPSLLDATRGPGLGDSVSPTTAPGVSHMQLPCSHQGGVHCLDSEVFCGEAPVVITDRDVPRTPVLLIPGIGGTLLDVRSSNPKVPDDRVWIRLWEADYTFRTKFWSKWNDATGEVECLDETLEVVVPEGRAGLYAVDTLDPDLRVRIDDLMYYHDVISVLTSWGYQEGVTLFGHGFDFRQSNRLPRHLAALEARLADIYEKSGGRKIDVITHSMGGLFLKCFLVLHREAFEKYINQWVALTAPWQGAPGYVIDALITGVQFTDGWRRELFVSKWSVHQLVMEMPSLHEMRSSPFFDWPELPTLNVWMVAEDEEGNSGEGIMHEGAMIEGEMAKSDEWKGGAEELCFEAECGEVRVMFNNEGKAVTAEVQETFESVTVYRSDCEGHEKAHEQPHVHHHRLHFPWWPGKRKQKNKANVVLRTHTPDNITGVLSEALADNHVDFQGRKIPLPLNQSISDYAYETQRLISNAQLPPGFKLYNIYGVGHRTPFHVCFGSESKPLQKPSDMLYQQATYVNHDGDGTVPVESGIADGMEATERIPVVAEHREILRSPETFAILRRVLDVPADAPSNIPAIPQDTGDEMMVATAIAAAQKRRPPSASYWQSRPPPPPKPVAPSSSPTCCSALS